MKTEEIKQIIKERYGKCAETSYQQVSCCGASETTSKSFAAEHGLYGQEELSLIPKIALNLSKGCGNPIGFANLQPGDTVVDFGCGAGIDVILAAHKVGLGGKVIGVDITPQMIVRAKQALVDVGLTGVVELLVSDLERIDFPDGFTDVVISNCVINLCPDKGAVYREAFRILKPGGRLAISDIVYTEKIDSQVQERFQSTWAGCVGGTIAEGSYFEMIQKTGFRQFEIIAHHILSPKELEAMVCCPGQAFTPASAEEDIAAVQGKVTSVKFTAVKPSLPLN